MINYQQRRYWKGILLFFAIIISLSSLWYTRILVNDLSAEERKMIDIVANAYNEISNKVASGDVQDISFLFGIVKTNENIPLILADTNDKVIESRNLDSVKSLKKGYLERQLRIMKSQHLPIVIRYSKNNRHIIYYKDSNLIYLLKIYPYAQLLLVLLFIFLAYFTFNSSRKYEQNKVWTGMSKETAHQLGTPVSSLMALSENIRENNYKVSAEILEELNKDIRRLEIITERFSKIGSVPEPVNRNIYDEIKNSLEYLRPRISKKVTIEFHPKTNQNIEAKIVPSLFDWVIENICKNAINAMEGSGRIEIKISDKGNMIAIDITDSGKGVPRNKQKTIFNPGYSTSTRGWGLGLSLTKRIIETYHNGQIYVKWSELGKGTTFRIKLRK